MTDLKRENETLKLDLVVANLDYKFTIEKIAESIKEIRCVLQWEDHRMGSVSNAVLRGAMERLEELTANAEVSGAGTASAGLPGYTDGDNTE